MSQNIAVFVIAMFFATLFVIGVVIFATITNHKYDKGQQPRDKLITKTRIIAVNGVEQTSSSHPITRAIIGAAIAGEAGAAIGALTARKKTETLENEYTFLVFYKDGMKETEKVKEYRDRFKFLISKLEG